MSSLLHNPRSALSSEALRLLHDAAALDVIDVVDAAPEPDDLAAWIARLPVAPRELLQQSDGLYFALGLDDPRWSDAEVLAAALDNPALLRCPIVIADGNVWLEHDALDVLAGA